MKVTCPTCGKTLHCPDDSQGKHGQCPRCKTKFEIAGPVPPEPPLAAPTPEEMPGTIELEDRDTLYHDAFIDIRADGTADFSVKSAAEAKLVIKTLKLLKKQLRLHLKDVMAQLQDVRSQYTDHVRRRGSMIRGGGHIGQIVRLIQTFSRDSTRRDLADHIAPLQDQKQHMDSLLLTLDQHIVRLEAFILKAE